MLRIEFQHHYADELRAAMAKPSNGYAIGLDADVVAAKMVAAIEAGTADTNGPALRSLAKRFGFKLAHGGLAEWYAANISDRVKSSIKVNDLTDLSKYLGETGFVKSDTNAYFGVIKGMDGDDIVHLISASDMTGDTGLELRVPRDMLWAVVDHPVRQPTEDDVLMLRPR